MFPYEGPESPVFLRRADVKLTTKQVLVGLVALRLVATLADLHDS